MTRNEAAETIMLMHERKSHGDMEGAYELAMSVDERFVKSAYDQLAIADVCIQAKAYEDALVWLKKVKEHSTSKRLLVQLIYVCLKLGRGSTYSAIGGVLFALIQLLVATPRVKKPKTAG